MKDIVKSTGMTMAAFAREWDIPYRTLQNWCDGIRPCPYYIIKMFMWIYELD